MSARRVERVAPQRDAPVVAIVGGGFSGAAVAMQIARRIERRIAIAMFDDAPALGRGVAYGVPGSHLLLNVPSGKLGWDPEQPDGFLRWLMNNGRGADASAFLPREWFGDYIQGAVATAMAEARGTVRFTHVRDRVVSARRQQSRVCIRTRDGGVMYADHVILAPGNGPTRCPEALKACVGDERLLNSPWDQDRLRALSRCRRVLLVGTGLTMCDAAVSMSRSGFDGELIAVSRHGLTPLPHGPTDPSDHAAWAADLEGHTSARLLRAVRARAKATDWRSVVDSLRPHLPRLWASLSPAERRRFVSRLATYWDVHRHRCPAETDAAIRVLREQGRLRVVAGHIGRVRPKRRALEVLLRGAPALDVDAGVLCTGPEPDPRRWRDPLLDQLLSDGAVAPDQSGLGIDTDDVGFAISSAGIAIPWLSTLGPLRRGHLWESTAVPELRRQAADLAGALAARLNDQPRSESHHTHLEINA